MKESDRFRRGIYKYDREIETIEIDGKIFQSKPRYKSSYIRECRIFNEELSVKIQTESLTMNGAYQITMSLTKEDVQFMMDMFEKQDDLKNCINTLEGKNLHLHLYG